MGSSPAVVALPPTLAEFERAASEALEPGPLDYYFGGAGDELTLLDNAAAWRRYAIRPRVLVDVSQRDLTTTVLGRDHPHPIFVAPTAFHRLCHPEGEKATARGSRTSWSTRRSISLDRRRLYASGVSLLVSTTTSQPETSRMAA